MTQDKANTKTIETAKAALKHHQDRLSELQAGKNLVGDNKFGTQKGADIERHQAAIVEYEAILEARRTSAD